MGVERRIDDGVQRGPAQALCREVASDAGDDQVFVLFFSFAGIDPQGFSLLMRGEGLGDFLYARFGSEASGVVGRGEELVERDFLGRGFGHGGGFLYRGGGMATTKGVVLDIILFPTVPLPEVCIAKFLG